MAWLSSPLIIRLFPGLDNQGFSDTSETQPERLDSDHQINISRLISFLALMMEKRDLEEWSLVHVYHRPVNCDWQLSRQAETGGTSCPRNRSWLEVHYGCHGEELTGGFLPHFSPLFHSGCEMKINEIVLQRGSWNEVKWSEIHEIHEMYWN